MATKRKAATKKAGKIKLVPNTQIIYILPGGLPSKYEVPLDADGVKYPSKVYWQAIIPTTRYRIILNDAPAPFKNPPDPIFTDLSGITPTLKLDKQCPKRKYYYTVDELTARRKWNIHSGGGIIVDA